MRTLFFTTLLAISALPLTAAAGVPYTFHDGATPASNAINLTVNFENGSAVLTADARMSLDKLGAALSDSRLAGQKFRIGCHISASNGGDQNLVLSQRRAEAVRDYLIAHFNLVATQFTAVGYGSTRPLVPDDPANAANDRIEIVNLTAAPERQ